MKTTLLFLALAGVCGAQTQAYPPPGGGSGGSSGSYSTASAAYTTAQYFPPGGGLAPSATESTVQGLVSIPGTVSNLSVRVSAVPGGTASLAFTFRKNGADTALTCTITAASQTCSDLTHSFAIVANDLLSIKVIGTNTPAASAVIASWGTPGTVGPQGPQGITGATGTAGANGAIGTTGPTGLTGLTGPAGGTGATGSAGAGYTATSATSITTCTSCTLTFTTQAGLAYLPGNRVRVAWQTTPADYVEGPVTSYSGTTLVMNSDHLGGSVGTWSGWNIGLAGDPGTASTVPGPTGPTGATGGAVLPSGSTGQVLQNAGGTSYTVVTPAGDVTGPPNASVVSTVNGGSPIYSFVAGAGISITPSGGTATIANTAPAGATGPTGPTGPSGGGGGTPAGSSLNLQANLSGSFAAVPNSGYNATSGGISLGSNSAPTTGPLLLQLLSTNTLTTNAGIDYGVDNSRNITVSSSGVQNATYRGFNNGSTYTISGGSGIQTLSDQYINSQVNVSGSGTRIGHGLANVLNGNYSFLGGATGGLIFADNMRQVLDGDSGSLVDDAGVLNLEDMDIKHLHASRIYGINIGGFQSTTTGQTVTDQFLIRMPDPAASGQVMGTCRILGIAINPNSDCHTAAISVGPGSPVRIDSHVILNDNPNPGSGGDIVIQYGTGGCTGNGSGCISNPFTGYVVYDNATFTYNSGSASTGTIFGHNTTYDNAATGAIGGEIANLVEVLNWNNPAKIYGYHFEDFGGRTCCQSGYTGTFAIFHGGPLIDDGSGDAIFHVGFSSGNNPFGVLIENPKMVNQFAGPLALGTTAPVVSGALLQIFAEKSTTGTRYLCIDTTGNVHSSASACSGT